MMLDIILGIASILLVVWGLYKGLIRGLMSFITGILLYVSLSKMTLPVSGWMVESWGSNYGWSIVLSVVLQIIIISAITMITTKLVEMVITTLNLNVFNRILGAFFGLLAMQFVITLFVIFIGVIDIDFMTKQVEKSNICHISAHINSNYLKPVFGKDINTYLQDYLDKKREKI